MTADGMIAVQSTLDLPRTIERFESVIRGRGMTVFSRFDHAANARDAGLTLRPTTIVWFGDARVGTKLMAATPSLAIDLPHRVLVYTDDAGQTWLAYNDPHWLARRHGIAIDAGITATAAALAAIMHEAAS